jgi:hypothetical protein
MINYDFTPFVKFHVGMDYINSFDFFSISFWFPFLYLDQFFFNAIQINARAFVTLMPSDMLQTM